MKIPPYLEVADGLGRVQPQGDVSLLEAVELVSEAIVFCRVQSVPKLLIDLTHLNGFDVPSLVDRFWMTQDWAEAARGLVIVAIVAEAEHIHPRKFGTIAAADAGLVGDVFASESEAKEWLLKM